MTTPSRWPRIRRTGRTVAVAVVVGVVLPWLSPATPVAHADNRRLNQSVVANVYTVRYQSGCDDNLRVDPKLRLAAQWHAADLIDNRNINRDNGSDGSTAHSRAAAAGYRGAVAQTVAINPALAINNLDVINQWFADPAALAIMRDCGLTDIGVWSENSFDRSVVVAVYGSAAVPAE